MIIVTRYNSNPNYAFQSPAVPDATQVPPLSYRPLTPYTPPFADLENTLAPHLADVQNLIQKMEDLLGASTSVPDTDTLSDAKELLGQFQALYGWDGLLVEQQGDFSPPAQGQLSTLHTTLSTLLSQTEESVLQKSFVTQLTNYTQQLEALQTTIDTQTLYNDNVNQRIAADTTPVDVDFYRNQFWDVFMAEIYPSVSDNVLQQHLQKTANSPILRQFQAAAEDFYEAFFLGRDDTTATNAITPQQWNAYPEQVQQAAITQYLQSRTLTPMEGVRDAHYLEGISQLGKNPIYWAMQQIMSMLEKVQSYTIEVGNLASRFAEAKRMNSEELLKDKYVTEKVSGPDDFATIHKNQETAKSMQALRADGSILQTHADLASSQLQQAADTAETQSTFLSTLAQKERQILKKLTKRS